MLSIRHVSLAVAVGAILVPHWIDVLRTPGDGPGTFVVGMGLAVLLTAVWAVLHNRRQRSP